MLIAIMKTLKQTVTFNATPEAVYDALMDAKKHAQFTGSKAVISKKIGGKFSTYDGGLHGTNIQLIPGKKIVQAWRCEMADWPKEYFSQVTLELKKVGNKTKLIFTQTRIPDKCAKSIAQGWKDYYWIPLKEMLE